jgi:hypothetical protein
MAKQTFTTGQVLTAAQMTSLQDTAMGGGAASTKTANYVLVAADAGTTVAMNAAGATTITVNTGLFAAGDTVFIQNIGAGATTITAGTATVNTAGSLILPQYDAGILYFTSASAAIFYDYIQVGAASPLTTKGDLYTFSTSDTRLGVGANNTVLTADSAQATGLKWAAPAAGALTFIQRSSFSDVATTSTTFDGVFTSTYKAYQVVVEKIHAASGATAGEALQLQFIYSGTTQILTYNGGFGNGGATYFGQSSSDTSELKLTNQVGYDVNPNSYIMWFSYVGNASEKANVYGLGFGQNNNGGGFFAGGNATARTYTGFRFKAASGNITGTVAVYGIASS